MPCYNRQTEDSEHQKRRVALVRRNFNHLEIDAIFENEIYENMTWKQLKESQRKLDQDREQFEEEKKVFETQVQETQNELENLEAQIVIKKQIVDKTDIPVAARKLGYFITEANIEEFADKTLIVLLDCDAGNWYSLMKIIPRVQKYNILETCDKLSEEA